MRNAVGKAAAAGVATVMLTTAAWAAPASPLLQLGKSELRDALDSRYDTAVKAVGDASVRAAQDSRWTYAVEAKNQCGIAIGFIKSGTKDADSINKRSEEHTSELQSLMRISY